MIAKDIAKMIDYSLLNPTMTVQDIEEGCKLAKKYDLASMCVKPSEVPVIKKGLEGSDVYVSTVIGFPHGSNRTEVKVFETELAIKDGCNEVDMVINIGRLMSGDYEYVENDIKAVVDAAHAKDVRVKVIFETCYLNEEQKIKVCQICEKVGADFVKTSTGYGSGGATIPDLKLMRANVSPKLKVKASGGIRTLENALAARAAGAVRLGATAAAVIMDEAIKREAEGTLIEESGEELGKGY